MTQLKVYAAIVRMIKRGNTHQLKKDLYIGLSTSNHAMTTPTRSAVGTNVKGMRTINEGQSVRLI